MTDDQIPNKDTGQPTREPTGSATPHAEGAAATGPALRNTSAGESKQARETEKDGFGAVTSWIGKVLRILFTPLIWLLRPLVFRVSSEKNLPKVYFTSFSPLVYLWPITVVGVVGTWLHNWGWVGASVMGWIWITTILLVILSIGTDIDRTKALFIIILGFALWVSGILVEEKQGIPVISHVYDYLAGFNVSFNPGTAQVFSIATFIILIIVVISAWFDGRYEITTREISHKRLFRTTDSLPRAAKRIKQEWRDLAELFFGLGAGDLVVLDSNKNIVMRIPNVPFLLFFRRDVDHILEVLATTEVEEAAVIEEEDLA